MEFIVTSKLSAGPDILVANTFAASDIFAFTLFIIISTLPYFLAAIITSFTFIVVAAAAAAVNFTYFIAVNNCLC